MAPLGDFIDGGFRMPKEPSAEWRILSPADLSDEVGVFQSAHSSIDESIAAARKAFVSWKQLTSGSRADSLRRLRGSLARHQEGIVEVISREVGKPRWEARSEMAAMLDKIDITLTESARFAIELEIPDLMDGTRGSCRYRPRGVMVVIGPFPFPGLLPLGQAVPALLMGNTVVLKPSEKAPLTGEWIARCFQEAEFPPGVFNLIQGGADTGRRLCVHEGVDGILFTGSHESGTRIKQDTLSQHWKLLSLQMGGKNAVIVWEDAELEYAVQAVLVGAFLTAGQRCDSTSRVVVHSRLFEPFVEALHRRAKAFRIGPPKTEAFMGPLIDSSAVDRYLKFQGIAAREGGELVMRGKSLELDTRGHYVTPSICRLEEVTVEQVRKSAFQQIEILAPNVVVMKASELEQAIALANATQYGLVASVFSANRSVYLKCWEDLQAGVIHWNKATTTQSSRLPFGGLRKSGNHRSAGLMAVLSCADPIASFEMEHPPVSFVDAYPGL